MRVTEGWRALLQWWRVVALDKMKLKEEGDGMNLGGDTGGARPRILL